MGFFYRTLATYEPLIYIALAIGGLFAFRRMWNSWREWRDSVYGLEREFALQRLGRATALALLILGLVFAEFFIATFIAPSLPASDIIAMPALRKSPRYTSRDTFPGDSLSGCHAGSLPNGMSGCIADKIMIDAPTPGDDVEGTISITGTADVPNFGFYKYEVSPMGSQNWATIAANRNPVRNEELGKWNTASVTNGDRGGISFSEFFELAAIVTELWLPMGETHTYKPKIGTSAVPVILMVPSTCIPRGGGVDHDLVGDRHCIHWELPAWTAERLYIPGKVSPAGVTRRFNVGVVSEAGERVRWKLTIKTPKNTSARH